MPGVLDPRTRFIVIPCMTLGLILSIIALALSISQFIIQLRNNSGTSINTKPYYDPAVTHADAPVFTLCGPQPFNTAPTRCFVYDAGLRPVQREGDDTRAALNAHKRKYGLQECYPDTTASFGNSLLFHDISFHVYEPWDGTKVGALLSNSTQFELAFNSHSNTIVSVRLSSSDDGINTITITYPSSSAIANNTEVRRVLSIIFDLPQTAFDVSIAGNVATITNDGFVEVTEVQHCVSFSKEAMPSSLGAGTARRLFLELLYSNQDDYQVYTLRLWDPSELRTPEQARNELWRTPEKLYAGNILTLPYSLSGTALFSNWQTPFPGPDVTGKYYPENVEGPAFGPVAIRAGISAIVEVQEEGTQSLDQEEPFYYYRMKLASLNPEIQYPQMDTSKFVTIAFQWDSDTTFYYQEVLAITNVGMAALLISTIAFVFLAVADAAALYVEWDHGTRKT